MNGCADETPTAAPANWAERVLARQDMPPNEISAILATDEPEMVRRYLELHRERLEERLADRLREVDAIQAQLLAMQPSARGH